METIKKNSSKVLFLAVIALVCSWAMLGNAGSLNPSAPPAPTMKTLDEVEARTPIKASDLPLTISSSGSYYLAETINFATENTTGINITVGNVTIDLNGYSLIGPGTGTSGHGITASGSKITVINGSVSGWKGNGISLAGTSNKVMNITSTGNKGNGISVGSQSILADCESSENELDGITIGDNSIARYCITYGNWNRGIVTGGCTKVFNCVVRSNDNGGIIAANRCFVSECISYRNSNTSSSHGIDVGNESSVINCIAAGNGGNGIESPNGGVVINCTASDNDDTGIRAWNSIIVNNTAYDNTTNWALNSCTTPSGHNHPAP